MGKLASPFKPTVGAEPPVLVGREGVLMTSNARFSTEVFRNPRSLVVKMGNMRLLSCGSVL